jgi:peroxiredoxin
LDKDKLVKAIVLRKATEEEQQFMRSMQEGAMPMDGAVNVSVGTAAKDFNVTDIKEKKYTLSELKGKVVVMSFWFVECKPCVMEMPELNALVQQFKDDEVVFIGVATNDKKQLKQFLKTTAFDYHNIPSAQTLINEYSISAFPTNIVIDQNGIIQYSVMGIGPNNSNNLMNTINELLKK